MKSGSVRVCAGILLVALTGCGGREGKVLAKIGNRKITVRDYEQAIPRVPSQYASKKNGIDGKKENLQILVDRELFILEAENRGIDKEKGFLDAWEDAKRELLTTEMTGRVAAIKDKSPLKAESKTLSAKLMSLFDAEFDRKTLAYVLEKGKTATANIPEVPMEQESRAIVTFKGGKYTVGDHIALLGQLTPKGRPKADDSTRVVDFVRSVLSRGQLTNMAIKHFKLEDDPKIVSRLRDRRLSLMTDALAKREVGEKVQISAEEVETYYQAHRARLLELVPAQAHIRGVAMETERDAIKLRRTIKGSEDLQRLVEQYQGKAGWPVAGDFHLHPFQIKTYGDVATQAFQVPVGKMIGPVRVPSGFMIYEVVDREDQGSPESAHYAKVRQTVRAELHGQKASELYRQFLFSLRRKYADQTFIYDDRINLVKSAADTTRASSPDSTRAVAPDTAKAAALDATTTRKG